MKEYQTIIDFDHLTIADAKWHAWLETNDIANLDPDDVIVDTGRGQEAGKSYTTRRYRIRKEAMDKVKAKSI